jgi:O-methyltransferase
MKSVPLTQELFDYIEKISVPDDPLCKELLAETLRLEIPMIQISTDQARFLYLLTKMINAKHALEIGTLAGYSGIHIARGLAEEGTLTTVDINPNHSKVAARFFELAGLKDKVYVVTEPAVDHMKKLVNEGKKFDLIFIDADKTGYHNYYNEALNLSHKGSVIIFDNMLKGGNVIDVTVSDPDLDAVREMNELLANDERIECLLMTIGDGMTICLVK